VILDNGYIFIGVSDDNKKQIIFEDITNKKPPEIIAQHEDYILSLLANEALNIFWAGDRKSNIFEYVLGPGNGWKVQAKYSDLGIGQVWCLSLFGNLLFAGGNKFKVCVINTADKRVLPQRINTAIIYIESLQICQVSPSEIYLTVIGSGQYYSSKKSDLFDISKFQELSFAEKIFSEPGSHINSIHQQFKNTYPLKKQSVNCKNSKVKNLCLKKN
jgi:hypothetical protein